MSATHASVRPNAYVFLRLPPDSLRLIEVKANSTITIPKWGSFPANLLIGRPYHYTYELLEAQPNESFSRLRVVLPDELNADILAEEAPASELKGQAGTPVDASTPDNRDVAMQDVTAEVRNNRHTVDDATRQTLTHLEIEELKRSAGGKEIIERILANHSGIEEKTTYSKAKYMLRKRNKYIKRFTVLPMELSTLMLYISEKEAARIMEIRDEALGLLTSYSNVHMSTLSEPHLDNNGKRVGGSRWLCIDDAGGVVVAALAERMAVLQPQEPTTTSNGAVGSGATPDHHSSALQTVGNDTTVSTNGTGKPATVHRDFVLPSTTNSITLIHAATQPNVSLLKFFGYDTNEPDPDHPLHQHLKTLSWLQLLHLEEDPTYLEPPVATDDELKAWKSSKRGNYYRKRRRWQRCAAIVDETREGGFDGLIIATVMDHIGILRHAVPLLRGGATISIYSPSADPLVKIMDLYSKERRTAYMQHVSRGETPDLADFPVDPRLLLGPSLQSSRVRAYQVLPGRTHPLMTSKGGPDGYIMTARRAIPIEGVVEARGNHSMKRRKTDG